MSSLFQSPKWFSPNVSTCLYKTQRVCGIWDFHSSEYENYCHLGYDTVA
jgi:hypothetical protein